LFGYFFFVLSCVLGFYHSVALQFLAGLPSGPMRELLLVGASVIAWCFVLLVLTGVLVVPAHMITRTIGVQLQRRAVAGLATREMKGGWGYARLLPTAFLLALGMEIGFHAVINLIVPSMRESLAAVLIWLASFTLLTWLWLAYVHGLSRMLLGSYSGRANPRLRRSLVTGSSVALLTVLYWPASLARLTVQALPLLLRSGAQLSFGMEPRRVFVYGFFITTINVLIFALVIYSLWVLASLAVLRLGPLGRRGRCSTCGEETLYMLNLGRACHGCGEWLAPWIFLDTAKAPQTRNRGARS
jgi:hypothetical protein